MPEAAAEPVLNDSEFLAKVNALADVVAEKNGCDVLLFSGYINRFDEDAVIHLCGSRPLREKVTLLLATFGGSPDAAYRIARTLQQRHKHVTVFVYGLCKSSGTLIVLGADDLVMSDFAELGPLDIQVRKPDEVGELGSGLTPLQSLDTLRARAFDSFQENFNKFRNDMQMTSKMAAQVATEMTVGLLGNVYSQVDPMRLGELDRQVRIALDYGQRLTAGQRTNVKNNTLAKLVSGYPSHGFVIDRAEAKELFHRVRVPTVEETALAEAISHLTRWPVNSDSPTIAFLGKAQGQPAQVEQASEQATAGTGGTGPAGEVAPADGGAAAGEAGAPAASPTEPTAAAN